MNDVVEFKALCRMLKLPGVERGFVKVALRAEDELLLGEFTKLLNQKPLDCTLKVPG